MSGKTNKSPRTRRGAIFLSSALGGVFLAYYLSVHHGDLPSPDATPADQPYAAAPLPDPQLENSGMSPEKPPSVDAMNQDEPLNPAGGVHSAMPPDSQLGEAELERLSDVFLNVVYPLFRYEFQLNPEGRSALMVFVASMPTGLGSEDLETIAAMIETQLASPEAEDLAFMITRLYQLEAEEARIMRERAPVTTMAGQLEVHEQLSELRNQWFGPDLAARLFSGNEEPPALSGGSPENDEPERQAAGASPEALSDEQAELAALERAWEDRYQEYLADKRLIERAGLDQSEKDRQIESLLRQHYSPREIEAARAFDQMRN